MDININVEILRYELNYVMSYANYSEKQQLNKHFQILLLRYFFPGENCNMAQYALKEVKNFIKLKIHDKQNVETVARLIRKIEFELLGTK